MSEEIRPSSTEKPRHCPQCGTRVAALAKTCLMCGADLTQEAPPEAFSTPPTKRAFPRWARAAAITGFALLIVAAMGLGLTRLTTPPPPSPSPTQTSTPTPTATASPTPSLTPTPSSTPTPLPPRSHQVQQGETLSGIAQAYNVTVEEILVLNPDLQPELIREGQVLLIPPARPASETLGDSTPTASAGNFIIHIVQPGEALLTIAQKYNVSVQSIRLANNMGPYEDTLQVNQSLVIPLGTPTPTPSPTPDPNATPTPTSTPLSPALLAPPDHASFTGTEGAIVLQWTAVTLLATNEWYMVELSDATTGIVKATHLTRTTAWRVPFEWLQEQTGQGGEFQWRVRVVRAQVSQSGEPIYRDIASPSPRRVFTWRVPTPTPTP